MIVACDFESFYSKDVSITIQGVYHYLRHPEQDIYMVSIVSDTGIRFCGRPEEFDWSSIDGATWLAHNAAFDSAVYERLVELNPLRYTARPSVWHCTADMAAYLGYPRSLKEACKHLLNIDLSKDTRDKMKGKRWESMSEDFKKEVTDYAMRDSEYCLLLWQKHSDKWPQWERELSLLTREMGNTGVLVDKPYLEECVGNLRRLLWAADKEIPWASEGSALSYKKLCEACRAAGIKPPPSLAMDDEMCAAWEEEFGGRYPWVFAMRTKRRANTLLKKFEALLQRIRPDGRVTLPTKYAGCHTRRWSGDSGINAQNMSRDAMLKDEMVHFRLASEGVEMRKAIIAPAGHKLVACDLAQIEPRVLAVLSGDTAMLDFLRAGTDLYEAHARATLGYDRKEKLKSMAHIPEFELVRRLSKARILGLSYGCGWHKFVSFAKTALGSEQAFNSIFGAAVTSRQSSAFYEALVARKDPVLLNAWKQLDDDTKRTWVNSWKTVTHFRETNPKITGLWRRLQSTLESSVGEDMIINLPSGNKLTYRGVHTTSRSTDSGQGQGYACYISRMGKMMREFTWGSKICENIIQAAARDVFATGLLNVHKAGKKIILQTHDEQVCEQSADSDSSEIVRLMTIVPGWVPTLPLAAEATEGPNYAI